MNKLKLPDVSFYDGVEVFQDPGLIKVVFPGEITFFHVEGQPGTPAEKFFRLPTAATTRAGKIDDLIIFMRHRKRFLMDTRAIEVGDSAHWLRNVPPSALIAMKAELKKFDSNTKKWTDGPAREPASTQELQNTMFEALGVTTGKGAL